MFNKKGLMDNVFDFMFTVIVGLFMLFFIGFVMLGNVNKIQERGLSEIGKFKVSESALNNLRILIPVINMEHFPVDSYLSSVKVLEGRTITTCSDYWKEEDCRTDPIELVEENECSWLLPGRAGNSGTIGKCEKISECIHYTKEDECINDHFNVVLTTSCIWISANDLLNTENYNRCIEDPR